MRSGRFSWLAPALAACLLVAGCPNQNGTPPDNTSDGNSNDSTDNGTPPDDNSDNNSNGDSNDPVDATLGLWSGDLTWSATDTGRIYQPAFDVTVAQTKAVQFLIEADAWTPGVPLPALDGQLLWVPVTNAPTVQEYTVIAAPFDPDSTTQPTPLINYYRLTFGPAAVTRDNTTFQIIYDISYVYKYLYSGSVFTGLGTGHATISGTVADGVLEYHTEVTFSGGEYQRHGFVSGHSQTVTGTGRLNRRSVP